MKSAVKLALATGALASIGLVGAPAAQAGVAQHCPTGGTKYQVNTGPDLYVGLPAGTSVCIKTGTQAYYVQVDQDGYIHSTVWNGPGKGRLGISYWVSYVEECVPTYPTDCGGTPS